MLLFIMFLVCSSCIFDIVIADDEFMHMFIERLIQFLRELGGTYYVSVMLRYYLPMNAPYMRVVWKITGVTDPLSTM
jgi:hypothetical protein